MLDAHLMPYKRLKVLFLQAKTRLRKNFTNEFIVILLVEGALAIAEIIRDSLGGGIIPGLDAHLFQFIDHEQAVQGLAVDVESHLLRVAPRPRAVVEKVTQMRFADGLAHLLASDGPPSDGAKIPFGAAPAPPLGVGREINHKADDCGGNNQRPQPLL